MLKKTKAIFIFLSLLLFTSCNIFSNEKDVEQKDAYSNLEPIEEKLTILVQEKADTNYVKKITDSYKIIKPNVTIEILYAENFYVKFNELIELNDIPDIIIYKPFNFYYYELVKKNYLYDLETLNLSLDENIKKAVQDTGGNYVMPITGSLYGIILNRELFESQGLETPKDFQSLSNASVYLKQHNKNVFSFYSTPGNKFLKLFFNLLSISSYDNVYDFLKQVKEKGAENNNESLNRFATYIDLIFDNIDYDTIGYDYDQNLIEFASKRSFMTFGTSEDYIDLLNMKDNLSLDFVPIPLIQSIESTQSKNLLPLEVKKGISICSQSENKELASEFLKFFRDKQIIDYYSAQTKSLSLINNGEINDPKLESINDILFNYDLIIDNSDTFTKNFKNDFIVMLANYINNRDYETLKNEMIKNLYK